MQRCHTCSFRGLAARVVGHRGLPTVALRRRLRLRLRLRLRPQLRLRLGCQRRRWRCQSKRPETRGSPQPHLRIPRVRFRLGKLADQRGRRIHGQAGEALFQRETRVVRSVRKEDCRSLLIRRARLPRRVELDPHGLPQERLLSKGFRFRAPAFGVSTRGRAVNSGDPNLLSCLPCDLDTDSVSIENSAHDRFRRKLHTWGLRCRWRQLRCRRRHRAVGGRRLVRLRWYWREECAEQHDSDQRPENARHGDQGPPSSSTDRWRLRRNDLRVTARSRRYGCSPPVPPQPDRNPQRDRPKAHRQQSDH